MAPPPPTPSSVRTAEGVFQLSKDASLEEIREQIEAILTNLSVVKPNESLRGMFERVRPDLESLQQDMPAAGFRKGIQHGNSGAGGGGSGSGATRNFGGGGGAGPAGGGGGGAGNWRQMRNTTGNSSSSAAGGGAGGGHTWGSSRNASMPFGTTHNRTSFTQSNRSSSDVNTSSTTSAPRPPAGKYQSRFKREGAIQDKILNSIIGNKLNTFSPVTYNDVRDFIYQILDSGETEFIRDFVEKVFMKATQEDIYCALFAKLLSEISSKYSSIRTEMEKYHKEFLKVFDSIEESKSMDYEVQVKQKQYRMGYGQFMSDLAGLNTLDPSCLYAMTDKILENIEVLTASPDKEKTVEEYVDCYVRMMKALRQKNNEFFVKIRPQLESRTCPRILPIIEKKGDLPSLTTKARFGLMDLNDILSPS